MKTARLVALEGKKTICETHPDEPTVRKPVVAAEMEGRTAAVDRTSWIYSTKALAGSLVSDNCCDKHSVRSSTVHTRNEVVIFPAARSLPHPRSGARHSRHAKSHHLYTHLNPFQCIVKPSSRPPEALLGASKQLSEPVSSVILMPSPYVGNIGLLPIFDGR